MPILIKTLISKIEKTFVNYIKPRFYSIDCLEKVSNNSEPELRCSRNAQKNSANPSNYGHFYSYHGHSNFTSINVFTIQISTLTVSSCESRVSVSASLMFWIDNSLWGLFCALQNVQQYPLASTFQIAPVALYLTPL